MKLKLESELMANLVRSKSNLSFTEHSSLPIAHAHMLGLQHVEPTQFLGKILQPGSAKPVRPAGFSCGPDILALEAIQPVLVPQLLHIVLDLDPDECEIRGEEEVLD